MLQYVAAAEDRVQRLTLSTGRAKQPRTADFERSGADQDSGTESESESATDTFHDCSEVLSNVKAGTPVTEEEGRMQLRPRTRDNAADQDHLPSPMLLEASATPSATIQQSEHPEHVNDRPSAQAPRYLSPILRHPTCQAHPSPCTSLLVSYNKQERRGSCCLNKVFRPGEATDGQVRWLVAMSGCSMAEFMHQLWLSRLRTADENPLPLGWGKETFLSHYHWSELNKIAALRDGEAHMEEKKKKRRRNSKFRKREEKRRLKSLQDDKHTP